MNVRVLENKSITVQVENDKILDLQDFIINLSVLITIMIIFGKKIFLHNKVKNNCKSNNLIQHNKKSA
jgi:hypothetical protein